MKKLSIIIALGLVQVLFCAYSCENQGNAKVGDAKEDAGTAACAKDEDCGVIKADCCGCNQGGKQQAVAKAAAKAWSEKMAVTCQDIMCAQVISNDASCKKTAVCVQGACELK